MKYIINTALLLTVFLITSQSCCMNKDNITKPTIEELLADKKMKIILKNELKREILDQQEQFEQRVDMEFAKRITLGAIAGGATLYAIENVSIFTLGIYLFLVLINQ